MTEYKNSKLPFFKKSHKYDGYLFDVCLNFDDLKGDGDIISMAILLPNGSGEDLSMFGWVFKVGTGYVPFSKFVDGVTGEVTDDNWWICTTYPEEPWYAARTTGLCTHPQPVMSASSGGNYRWSAYDTALFIVATVIDGTAYAYDVDNTGVVLLSAT